MPKFVVYPVAMPDVTGNDLATALATLTDYEVPIELVEDNSDTVDEGKIISQSPLADQDITLNTTITLTVSLGAEDVANGRLSRYRISRARRRVRRDANIQRQIAIVRRFG